MKNRNNSNGADVQIVGDDWLAVSTDGFAAMNAGREPAHLVKELVQNALDAAGRTILLDCTDIKGGVGIRCYDDGHGIENLADIRTVFHTTKTDSPLQRGRMGRGFKEMLCLALHACVTSGTHRIEFYVDRSRRRTRVVPAAEPVKGTLVEMLMPWQPLVIPRLVAYFQTLLIPATVQFYVNHQATAFRQPSQIIDASLPTEMFSDGRWIKPIRKTVIELVAPHRDEPPTVYEMGIPICPVGWTAPYHADVKQRVPMNPCRDAVASGYLLKLHRACLPTLLPELPPEEVRQDWVGSAAPHCDEQTQRQIISKGFGDNIARSVPRMGARQFDEDAREIGTQVVDTKQTSGGFREILQQHVPTTRQVVETHHRELVTAAAGGRFAVADAYEAEDRAARKRRELIESVGGRERVKLVMDFAGWFCQNLLDGYGDSSVCTVALALLKGVNAVATWSGDDVLTLGIDTPWLWTDPLGEESLATYIHEAGHHLNAHHGRDFHAEMEKLAGRAARIMLMSGNHIFQHYGALIGDAVVAAGSS